MVPLNIPMAGPSLESFKDQAANSSSKQPPTTEVSTYTRGLIFSLYHVLLYRNRNIINPSYCITKLGLKLLSLDSGLRRNDENGVVTPVKTGVQSVPNAQKTLDSGACPECRASRDSSF